MCEFLTGIIIHVPSTVIDEDSHLLGVMTTVDSAVYLPAPHHFPSSLAHYSFIQMVAGLLWFDLQFFDFTVKK